MRDKSKKELKLAFYRNRSTPGLANVKVGGSVAVKAVVSPSINSLIWNTFDLTAVWS